MFLVTLFLYTSILSQDIDSLLFKGLEFSYVENYDSAFYYFKKMDEIYPDNPAGYFMRDGLLLLYMTDFETVDSLKHFFSLADTTLIIANTYKKKALTKSDSAWAYFFEGGTYLYKGFWFGRKGNYIKAVDYGLTAIAKMDTSIKMDSTVYDAYLGTGGFHYFLYKLKHFATVGFYDNKSSIKEIELAVNKGYFSRIAAMDILVMVLIEEREFSRAWQLVDSLREMYPTSRTFQWAAVKIAEKEGKPYVAIKEYMKLHKMVKEGQPESYYNLIFTAYKIAEWAKKAKMYKLRDKYKNYILNHSYWGKYNKETAKYIKKARRL